MSPQKRGGKGISGRKGGRGRDNFFWKKRKKREIAAVHHRLGVDGVAPRKIKKRTPPRGERTFSNPTTRSCSEKKRTFLCITEVNGP